MRGLIPARFKLFPNLGNAVFGNRLRMESCKLHRGRIMLLKNLASEFVSLTDSLFNKYVDTTTRLNSLARVLIEQSDDRCVVRDAFHFAKKGIKAFGHAPHEYPFDARPEIFGNWVWSGLYLTKDPLTFREVDYHINVIRAV